MYITKVLLLIPGEIGPFSRTRLRLRWSTDLTTSSSPLHTATDRRRFGGGFGGCAWPDLSRNGGLRGYDTEGSVRQDGIKRWCSVNRSGKSEASFQSVLVRTLETYDVNIANVLYGA